MGGEGADKGGKKASRGERGRSEEGEETEEKKKEKRGRREGGGGGGRERVGGQELRKGEGWKKEEWRPEGGRR